MNIQKFFQTKNLIGLNCFRFCSQELSFVEKLMQEKLEKQFEPDYLKIVNESNRHSRPGTATHFNLTIVSDQFQGLNRIKKHKAVYKCLDEALTQHGVHALTITAKSTEEWQKSQDNNRSPGCKSKANIE